MENNESLFNEIKSAAENAENNDFPGMEKVWNRIEEKLDNKENKKAMLLWKKIAVAASLLLVTTLGYQFFKSNQIDTKPNEIITANDSIKKPNQTTNDIVTAEPVNPDIKKDAEQILQNQIKSESHLAISESTVQDRDDAVKTDTLSKSIQGMYNLATINNVGYLKSNFKYDVQKTKDIELFIDKKNKVSNDQKEEPLVIIDNKVEKKSIKDLEFDEADSLVVLKEPLYIINGVEYTEQEMFGPNPTSPYAPLNKQEIETLSVLQNEKAIEAYGKKGSKGVVIITTKNGKPVTASKKAK
ncbi:MAG TPA: hypothetical protein PKN96_12485 [Flavobacterium sp.]|uniref:hypothetical protein n=1 Tax=Flavobacterium sp. TaxID=239 RepID=UPI002CA348BE|nr:hypothetical protein [Flavobacterium sp.]HNP34102.1 hypothetical protein [Flavobacterium sp.]